jgi:hypothetical protein
VCFIFSVLSQGPKHKSKDNMWISTTDYRLYIYLSVFAVLLSSTELPLLSLSLFMYLFYCSRCVFALIRDLRL